MLIKVCTSYHRRISNITQACLDKLEDRNGLEFEKSKKSGSNVSKNRNGQVYDHRGVDPWADFFLFTDDDHGFEQSDIEDMVKKMEVNSIDVLGGAYGFKEPGFERLLVAGNWMPGFPGNTLNPEGYVPADASGLILCDWVPAGFLMVRRSVFCLVPPPWFMDRAVDIPPEAKYPFKQDNVGEDIGFCLALREAGIEVYLDADIRIKHHLTNKSWAFPLTDRNIHIGHKKGDVMENKDQNQKQTLPKSYASMALQLNQKNSEIITKMAMDYDSVVAMIQSKEEEIENLKVKLAEKESEISKLTSPVKEESTSA